MYPGTHAVQFPDKPAVVMAGTGETVTYQVLDDRSRRLARHLYDSGVRPGDVVALLSDNDPKAFEVYWAAMRSGLYITAVNKHMTADEVAYIVRDSGASVLVVSATLGQVAEAIGADTPDVDIRIAYNGAVDDYDDYEDVLSSASDEPLPSQPLGADMLYSSGTTGRPKGIKRVQQELQVDEPPGSRTNQTLKALYGFNADTIYLSTAPLYHAAPLRFGGAVHATGGTVVMMDRFEPEAALAAIDTYRVTHSQWVPTMLIRMLRLDESVKARYDLSSHRVAAHGAAPCPVDVKKAIIEWWGPIVYEYYSSTESNGMTFINSSQWLSHPGSVGTAVLGTLHICGDDGEELPVGTTGQVYFERDEMPFVYHNDPEKTAQVVHPRYPTWTTTGDIGRIDDEGYLYLTGRKGFVVISGGVNIYPQEIENALAPHPHVSDVAVIGTPDPEMGERLLAVVQPADGATDDGGLAEELIGYLRGRIAGYKIPREFVFVDDLPRTATGKLLKNELHKRYAPAAT